MNLSFKIAKRYLLGKKSHNIINLISLVSVMGVFTGTMALIIVLSVFNGFGNLVISLYDSFDPDIKIVTAKGKTFDNASLDLSAIRSLKGVAYATYTLEENGLVKYNDKQFIATIKGVDDTLIRRTGIATSVVSGTDKVQEGSRISALIGSGIAYSLGVRLEGDWSQLSIYMPDKNVTTLTNPESAFREKDIAPGGVFSIQQDFDSKYVLVPLGFVRELAGDDNRSSAVEVILDKEADEAAVLSAIKKISGEKFVVKTRLEQHAFMYKILHSEKWAVFLILSFIMVIGIFNILGTLTMLVIEKKEDILTLKYLGAPFLLVRNVFFYQGLMITLTGIVGGLLSGALICFLQQTLGIIKLGNAESFVVEYYPVDMQWLDFVNVFSVVFVIGALASLLISAHLVRKRYQSI